MNDEDFIEDSYLDPTTENGSLTISPQQSSFFAIDSEDESDVEAEDWVDVQQGTDIPELNNDFVSELENIVSETDCDGGIIRKIMSGRSIPSSVENRHKLREVVWPALLGVGKRDVGTIETASNDIISTKFKELDIDQESVPVAVLFCQSRGIEISDPLGDWIHLFRPISQLGISLSSQYRILHPISTRITPHAHKSLKSACDVILLLLQYHEPHISQKLSDLRLDVVKAFSPLLSSLFACSNSQAIPALWDAIFQLNDPIISIFLITVLIINCGEELEGLKDDQDFLRLLSSALNQIEEDDISDFIDLAIQYRDMTPRTYLEEKINPLFTSRPSSASLISSLCIEVNPSEAILSVACDPSCLNFVLFDVRPPEEFNRCHLQSTMHLETTDNGQKIVELISNHIEALQMNPEESHVLLIGESENDPNVFSFVSLLLKEGHKYISIINGGFTAIHEHIETPESHLDPSQWLVKEQAVQPAPKKLFSSFNSFSKLKSSLQSINTKQFGDRMKAGFETIITEAESGLGLKNTSATGNKGKKPVFSIDDDSESDDDNEEQLNMETFLKRKDLKGHWEATGVQNKQFIIVLSSSQLIIMQPAADNKWAKIRARRPLHHVNRITSKKKCPELITFRYKDEAKDCFYIAEAGDATREIKRQVVAVLDAMGINKDNPG